MAKAERWGGWGLDVEYAPHERISLQIIRILINLDFFEEPSEKPTTDLIRVQMDGKASIGQSLQRISRVSSLKEKIIFSSLWLTKVVRPLSLSPSCVRRKKTGSKKMAERTNRG